MAQKPVKLKVRSTIRSSLQFNDIHSSDLSFWVLLVSGAASHAKAEAVCGVETQLALSVFQRTYTKSRAWKAREGQFLVKFDLFQSCFLCFETALKLRNHLQAEWFLFVGKYHDGYVTVPLLLRANGVELVVGSCGHSPVPVENTKLRICAEANSLFSPG